MTSLDALMDVVRAQMNDARRALAWAEMRHARALRRLADLDGCASDAPVMVSRRASSAHADRRGVRADEAAFAREAEALRELLVGAHAELGKLERLAELGHCARDGAGGRTARDHG